MAVSPDFNKVYTSEHLGKTVALGYGHMDKT
jgi:hypothetical protein